MLSFFSFSVFTVWSHAQYFSFVHGRFLLFRNTPRISYFARFVFTLSHASYFQGKIFVGIQKYFRVSPLQSFDLCSLSTMQWMHKLKLPNVSRSEVKGSIKITNRICKGLFIVYYSFNFGKENTTISGKTIEGQPYAFPPPQTSTETQIMMILIIYQTLPAALIENSHFNSKLVCLAMLKLYSKVLAKPSPLVSRWRASFQSRHAGIVWYITIFTQ